MGGINFDGEVFKKNHRIERGGGGEGSPSLWETLTSHANQEKRGLGGQ